MGPKGYLLPVLFCTAVSGCASHDLVVTRQTETEARLEQVLQAVTNDNARIVQLENELKEQQSREAATAEALQQLQEKFEETAASLETVTQRLAAQSLPPASKIEVVNGEVSADDKDSDRQNAYMKAFGLFSANNYEGAIDGFKAYLKKYPDGEYAGNAQYWIGECHYTREQFGEALEAFKKVVEHYPTGAKTPDAMLKIGYTLYSLNEPQKGKEALQRLVDAHPDSQAAARARERLSHQ